MGPVEPEEFSRRVASRVGEAADSVELNFDKVLVKAAPERMPEILLSLKSDPETDCEYFTFLSGVDWQADGFEVIVCVYSITHRNTVVVKCRLPKDNAVMPTLTGVYGGANWHERECHEMFGIAFEGHPNLTNLYLSDDFVGHPLLKDFRLASRAYKAWPGAKDPDEAAGGGRG